MPPVDPATISDYVSVLVLAAKLTTGGVSVTLGVLLVLRLFRDVLSAAGFAEGYCGEVRRKLNEMYFAVLPGEDLRIRSPREPQTRSLQSILTGAFVSVSIGIIVELALISTAAGLTIFRSQVLGRPTDFTGLARLGIALAILLTISVYSRLSMKNLWVRQRRAYE